MQILINFSWHIVTPQHPEMKVERNWNIWPFFSFWFNLTQILPIKMLAPTRVWGPGSSKMRMAFLDDPEGGVCCFISGCSGNFHFSRATTVKFSSYHFHVLLVFLKSCFALIKRVYVNFSSINRKNWWLRGLNVWYSFNWWLVWDTLIINTFDSFRSLIWTILMFKH